MGRLSLLILFYWLLLLENGPGFNILLIDLGNGMELRLSLILKLIFLVINILILIQFNDKHSIPKFFLVIGSFLILSTSYVLFVNPSGFLSALSVNLHILLMLNIVLFIRYNVYEWKQINVFMNWLRIFAVVNAILVIVSYLFPDLWVIFESGVSKTGVARAFGIMGDEVSIFLTFFLYDAIVFKRPIQGLIYAVAIFFTAGIGASITALLLLGYHLIFIMRKTRFNLYLSAAVLIPLLLTGIIFATIYRDVGIIKRIDNNLSQEQGESLGLRLLSFSVAAEMIRERPILGYGFGNYRSAVIKKYEPRFKEVGKLKFFRGSARVILSSSFNPFIQMLAEAGIIGLGIFIWFLIKLYNSTKTKNLDRDDKNYLLNQTSRAWLLIFIVSTLSANWFLPSSFLLLLVVSLVGINYKIKELSLVGPAE